MSETVQFREYQLRLEQQTYDAWASGAKAVLNACPTGGGKSVIMSNMILKGFHQQHVQSVIAHRNELVSQMSEHVGRRGVPHRIIGSDTTIRRIQRNHRTLFNGQQFVHPTARTSVVGVDTLVARQDDLKKWLFQHTHWMQDECFPSGTMIETPDGKKPIECLKIGDEVIAFNEVTQEFEYKKVTRLFKNPMPHNMVRLTTSTRHVIETTHGHPFWTKRGWVNAGDLNNDDKLFLFRMRSRDNTDYRKSALSLAKNWKNFLFEKVRLFGASKTLFQKIKTSASCENLSGLQNFTYTSERQNLLQNVSVCDFISDNESNKQKICFRENEKKESDEIGSLTVENVRNTEKNKTQTCSTRWKRKRNSRSGKTLNRVFERFWIYTSIRDKNQYEKGFRLSWLLQTRHGESRFENCNRSRWVKSSGFDQETDGSEKRFTTEFVGLESIEVYQPRHNGELEPSYVYNIEVDDLHTYIANEIVVHNCHHLLRDNKWGKAVELMPNALGSGFTATPSRADGKGLGRHADGVFDVMNIGPTMRWLIEQNYLADYELACPRSDLHVRDDEVSNNGDWSNTTLRKAAKESRIVGDVVDNYCKYAFMRRAIVFATDVETANEIAAKFKAAGIPAASLSAKTNPDAREKYIEDFKTGKIWVLINVDLFDEGFDVPACDVVIMARPTASLGKFLQMCGRALRYQPGKVALIIDMVSNIVRHGYPDKFHNWTLDRRDKRAKSVKDPDEIPLIECRNIPFCVKPYPKWMPACPHCGTEKPLPEPRQRTIEMVEGDLILLDREALARLRANTVIEAPADVAARVAAAAGEIAGKGIFKRQQEKVEAYEELKEVMAQWAGIERSRGFSDREIQRRFYHAAGMDVLTALDATRPRSEMESITNTIKSWWNKYDPAS